jgi:hypothetical protein
MLFKDISGIRIGLLVEVDLMNAKEKVMVVL